MLAQMRSLTRNWFARIFLGFIALAMAVTLFQGDFLSGITNLFNPSGVARVAGRDITDREIQREFNELLRRAQQESGGQPIPRSQAVAANLQGRALESIIQRRAVQAMAARLGVHASTAQVSEQIRQLPPVQNQMTGAFDSQAYEAFLQDIGYAPREFEEEIRQRIAGAMLLGALTAGVRAPSSYGALVLAYQSERRTVSVAEIQASALGRIPEPTPAQLQSFYEDNRSRFAVPEFRAATLVVARIEDFADRVQVTDEQLRQEFDRRRASLTTPEKRTFVQIAAPDEAKAREAAQRLSRGEDAQAIAASLGLQAVRQEERAQSEVADAAVRQAVFGMSPGAPAQALRARLSPWAAVRLESVTQSVTPSFEAEREHLRREIALQEGAALRDDALSAFERAADSGQPVAAAAAEHGLAVVQVPPVTAQGMTQAGQPAEQLLDMPDLLGTIFETPEGEVTDFLPEGDGVDVLVQVDRVIPETTRPLEEVRAVLVQQWTIQERARRLQDAAGEVAAAVRGGQGFAAAAQAANGRLLARSQTLDRQNAAQFPDQQFAQLVFAGAPGQVTSAVRRDAGAVLLVFVEAVERADPAENQDAVQAFRERIGQQLREDVALAVQAAAVDEANVSRNERRMQQLFPTDDQQQPGS